MHLWPSVSELEKCGFYKTPIGLGNVDGYLSFEDCYVSQNDKKKRPVTYPKWADSTCICYFKNMESFSLHNVRLEYCASMVNEQVTVENNRRQFELDKANISAPRINNTIQNTIENTNTNRNTNGFFFFP